MLKNHLGKIVDDDTRVWPLAIQGPSVTKWDITIRKAQLILSVSPRDWHADQEIPSFTVTGPDAQTVAHKIKIQADKKLVLLMIPCSEVLDTCRAILLDLNLGHQNQQERIPIRCITADDFTQYLQFSDNRRMSDGRKFSREIIAGLALRSSRTPELEPHFRVSAAVVHIYKALELPSRISLPSADYVAEFEALAASLLEQRGNIRTDGIQIYLSILTVGWHRALAVGDIPDMLQTLLRIRIIGRRLTAEDGDLRSQHRISYAKNIGISLLMLAYVQHLTGKYLAARNMVGDLYNFYTQTSRLLTDMGKGRKRVSIDPSWFKDTLECGHCTYLGLCINADSRGRSRTAIQKRLDISLILDTVLRVRTQAFMSLAAKQLAEYADRSPR